jgi:hypothetical protein
VGDRLPSGLPDQGRDLGVAVGRDRRDAQVEISQFTLSASVRKRDVLFPPCAHSPGITEVHRPAMTVTSYQVFDTHLARVAVRSLLTPEPR